MTGKTPRAKNTGQLDFEKVPKEGDTLPKEVLELKKQLSAERMSKQLERFIFIVITLVLLDMVLYSILGARTVPDILYSILGARTVSDILFIFPLVVLILLFVRKLVVQILLVLQKLWALILLCLQKLRKKDQESELPKDREIEMLENQLEVERQSRQQGRFIFIAVAIILLDVPFFSALDVWTGSLMLAILELLVLIVLGRQMGVEVVEEILDRILVTISNRK